MECEMKTEGVILSLYDNNVTKWDVASRFLCRNVKNVLNVQQHTGRTQLAADGNSGVPRNFVWGGSTNSVEDRENGDLGAVAEWIFEL